MTVEAWNGAMSMLEYPCLNLLLAGCDNDTAMSALDLLDSSREGQCFGGSTMRLDLVLLFFGL